MTRKELRLTSLTLAPSRDGIAPEGEVDFLYVLQAARRAFDNKDNLIRILDGEDLHRFPNSEGP